MKRNYGGLAKGLGIAIISFFVTVEVGLAMLGLPQAVETLLEFGITVCSPIVNWWKGSISKTKSGDKVVAVKKAPNSGACQGQNCCK